MSPVLQEDQAYVTLATSDAYAFGAATLAASLRRMGTTRHLCCMVTRTGLSPRTRALLNLMFDSLAEVDVFDSNDTANLALMGRPELGMTFTKLACWRLTRFKKAVFMDADTLVMQPIDDLFDREEFSAAPDVGWPDCFNSGVFVFRPSQDTYERLVQFALSSGSFDGADQGLLNAFFKDWVTDPSKRLPFTFNVAFAAAHFYSYLPAFVRFKDEIKVIHFLGAMKPWSFASDPTSGHLVIPSNLTLHALAVQFLELWWSIYNSAVRSTLKTVEPGFDGTEDTMQRAAWEAGQAPFHEDSFMNIQRFIDLRLSEPAAKPDIVNQIAAAIAGGPGKNGSKPGSATAASKPAPVPATVAAPPQVAKPAPAAQPAAKPAPAAQPAAKPAPAQPAKAAAPAQPPKKK